MSGMAKIESVLEAGVGELAELDFRHSHLLDDGIFVAEVCVEHCWIVSGKNYGNAMAKKLRKGMIVQRHIRSFELARQRARADVADGTNFQGNTAVGEKIHQPRIVNGGDAVADAFDAESFDGFTNCLRSANFAGVNQAMESGRGRSVVNWNEFFCHDTELISADPKRHNCR